MDTHRSPGDRQGLNLADQRTTPTSAARAAPTKEKAMSPHPINRRRLGAWVSRFAATAALILAALSPAGAQPKTIEVTDLAGRTVKVKQGAERVILGEGRLMYGTSILDKDDPFRRIVGWAEDMILYDPGTYRKYKEKFPQAETIPRFGSAFSGDFSAEKAIALNADLVLLPLSGYYRATETGILTQLEKAGVAAVFIDFREQMTQNTLPSINLLGEIFGREQEARAFSNFYLRETRKVMTRVGNKPDKDRVLVMMERAAGYDPNKCCLTFGNANLGALLQESGGINWGSARFSGLGGTMNPEVIFSTNPAVIIGTGADWAESTPASQGVPFGYETNPEAVQKALKALATRKGWETLTAVQEKRFYSVYHQFYTNPSHLVAMQVFAKWLYPDAFKDVDPEATLKEYHARFSPIPLSGVFWAQLK
jgi:iron complex transport system substrate-binding protein